VRRQFTHLTDIAPTLYDVIGITPPAEANGAAQMPFDGASFASTFASPAAPETHARQYFEMDGNAAIYDRGWMLATRMTDSQVQGNTMPDRQAPWLLFDLTRDPTETTDLAARFPAKAAELRALYDAEAARNHVLPQRLGLERLFAWNRPEYGNAPGRYRFTPGPWTYGEGAFPTLLNRDWAITAEITVPAGGASGTLVTQGGRFQGWGLLVRDGRPIFVYRRGDMPDLISRLAAPAALGPGAHSVTVRGTRDANGPGGTLAMTVDGAAAGSLAVPNLLAFKFGNEPAVIGRDTGTMLDGDPAPFAWPGTVTVTMDLGPITGSPASPPPHP
jgi:arylsulfatase